MFVKSWRTRFLRKLSMLLMMMAALISCSNIYEPMSSKTTDDALYEDAVKAADAQDYDLALAKFQAISSGYLSQVAVRKNYAGALAGKCGLKFTSFFTGLSSADFSTTPFFLYFMKTFNQIAVNPTYCTQAEAQIKAIWASNTPTASEQLFMVILSMAKMGAYLRNKADNDSTNNNGNGSTDGAFDMCANTDDTHHLTDDEVTEIVTGFALMLTNITGFAATLGLGSQIGSVTAICSIPGASTLCSATEASTVTAPMRDLMRDLLATGIGSTVAPMGVGSCAATDAVSLALCCP